MRYAQPKRNLRANLLSTRKFPQKILQCASFSEHDAILPGTQVVSVFSASIVARFVVVLSVHVHKQSPDTSYVE